MGKFWDDMPKGVKTGVYITGLVSSIWIILKIRKAIARGKIFPKKKYCYVQGMEQFNYNAHALAQEIQTNIDGGNNFWTYPETAQKILDLNDWQLCILNNLYNKDYALDYPTLKQLFYNEWDDLTGGFTYNQVVARLTGLGL